jgi:hypothetical protein
MELKIWSLSNPGLEPPNFRSLVQRANHCTNRAHKEEEKEEEEEEEEEAQEAEEEEEEEEEDEEEEPRLVQ